MSSQTLEISSCGSAGISASPNSILHAHVQTAPNDLFDLRTMDGICRFRTYGKQFLSFPMM